MPSTLQFGFNAAYDEGALLSIFNIKPAVSQRKGKGWQLRQGEMAFNTQFFCAFRQSNNELMRQPGQKLM